MLDLLLDANEYTRYVRYDIVGIAQFNVTIALFQAFYWDYTLQDCMAIVAVDHCEFHECQFRKNNLLKFFEWYSDQSSQTLCTYYFQTFLEQTYAEDYWKKFRSLFTKFE